MGTYKHVDLVGPRHKEVKNLKISAAGTENRKKMLSGAKVVIHYPEIHDLRDHPVSVDRPASVGRGGLFRLASAVWVGPDLRGTLAF